ncbi:sterol carrier protein 2-like [Lissotriton helveticus]
MTQSLSDSKKSHFCGVVRPKAQLGRMQETKSLHMVRSRHIQAVPVSAAVEVKDFKANIFFEELEKKLQKVGEQYVKKIGGIFAFKIKDGPGGKEALWVVDLKNGKGSSQQNFITS